MYEHQARSPRVLRGLFRAWALELRGEFWPARTSSRFLRIGAAMLGVALLWGAFALARFAIEWVQRQVPGAAAVHHAAIHFLVFFLTGALGYSSVLVSLSRVFLADSLAFVACLPATPRRLFVYYGARVVVAAGWVPATFGVALLAGIGVGLGAELPYFAAAVFGSGLYIATVAALGGTLATALAAVASVHRARNILIALSLVALVGLFVLLRGLDPERLLEPEVARRWLEGAMELRVPGAGWAPWWAFSSVLTALLAPGRELLGPSIVCAGWFLIALGAARAGFEKAYPKAFARSFSASGAAGASPQSARILRALNRLGPRRISALVRKDVLEILRDPSQWSQFLLLGGLALIYLFNVRAVPLDKLGVVGVSARQASDALAILNLIPVGFIAAAVALRFVFATLSMEGRSAWISLSAPGGIWALVAAKLTTGFCVVAALSLTLVVGTHTMLEGTPAVALLCVAGAAVESICITAMAAGIGLLRPRFRVDHPTEAVTSFGGFLFMGAALVYSIGYAVFLALPAYYLHTFAGDRGAELDTGWSIAAIVGALLALALSLLALVAPLSAGLARFDRYKMEA